MFPRCDLKRLNVIPSLKYPCLHKYREINIQRVKSLSADLDKALRDDTKRPHGFAAFCRCDLREFPFAAGRLGYPTYLQRRLFPSYSNIIYGHPHSSGFLHYSTFRVPSPSRRRSRSFGRWAVYNKKKYFARHFLLQYAPDILFVIFSVCLCCLIWPFDNIFTVLKEAICFFKAISG